MDTETSTLAFRTAINEIKNTCPGISNIFILDENKRLMTQDQNTTSELVDCAAESLATLAETACIAGGIESLTCSGTSQKINLTRYENNYVVTVASRETDEKALSTLARVMVPSMLKLAQEVATTRKDIGAVAMKPKVRTLIPTPAPAPTRSPQKTAGVPAHEFVVENISGISIISSSADTIHIDRVLIGQWKEIYGDKHIESATVENIKTGKRLRCKFQPIKNEKLEGQNVVLVPNRIQSKLEIKKGATVRIRAIIEDGEKKHE
jgi:hypothetical protein